jgi:hypothetical protein
MSALVFIHIPKVAGTSHREYLSQVYGEESIFWYGLDSEAEIFNKKELAKAPVVGGHRPLEFYPPAYKALYTTIIRDPLERAVSFFNYRATASAETGDERWLEKRATALSHWLAQGIDQSSMLKSIENCEEFRRDISNLQCRYLSRHGATFAGVRKTFQQTNIMVGVFDQLQKFNGFFQSELSFFIENNLRANTASNGYSAEILAEPGLVELIRSLNVEDQRLYDFVRYEHAGLYIDADNLPEIRKRVPRPKPIVEPEPEPIIVVDPDSIDWRKVQVFSKGILKVVPGAPTMVVVIIKNDTNDHLVFSKTEGGNCAIGWQFQDKSGRKVADIEGVAQGEQIVPPGQSKQVIVSLQIEPHQVHGVKAHFVEYSIFVNNRSVREEYPLNSSWAIVHMEHPAN